MSELEELKQYITKKTNYKFIFMLKQLTNERRAYEEIINDLKEFKTNFYITKYSHNCMQKLSFKNKEIEELVQNYKNKIIEKNDKIENLKKVYKEIKNKKSKILNKLKDVLGSDTKENKVLKCFLYNNNQNFKEWIIDFISSLLIENNPKDTKQRLNLLLEEFTKYLEKRDYYLCDNQKIKLTDKIFNSVTNLILNDILEMDVVKEIRNRTNPYKNKTNPHGL